MMVHSLNTGTFTNANTEMLRKINEQRESARLKGKSERDPAATYKLVCPCCKKPNALTVSFCTGCSFTLSEWDEQQMPDNVFLDLVQGQDIGATVHFRYASYIRHAPLTFHLATRR